ncbi:MAG: class I SAM-dependent methyltransferase [Gemmatimonadales bacterium]
MDPRFLASFRSVEDRHWWFRARRDLLIGLLAARVPPGGRIADLGCGTGHFLEAAAGRWETWGLEPSADCVAFCRERGLGRVLQGGIEDAERLLPGGFDAVTLLDVVEHLEDDVAALRTAGRLLRPGGTLLVTVPAYQWLWSGHDEVNRHRRRYTKRRLGAALAAAGVAGARVTYFNGFLLPLAVLDRLTSRVFRRPAPEQLSVPASPMNVALEQVFRLERPLVARGEPAGLPAGLSVLGVARHP